MALVEAHRGAAQAARTNTVRWRWSWLTWRTDPGFRWLDGLVLLIFFAVGAYTLRYHEAWDDEAQAWLIARDSTVWQMVRSRLHYEGAPPAWHVLLHVFHAFGGTYAGIGWLSLCLATLGIFVWLRWSPFPALLRYLLPFTFFLQYQYAVIARSYVLFPLLTFALCAMYGRPRKIIWFAFVAGLLANISLQGFLAALAFVGLYLFDLYRHRAIYPQRPIATPDSRARQVMPRRSVQLVAGALFALMTSTAIYCAIPAPDIDFAIGEQVSTGTVHRILMHLIGETARNAPRASPEAALSGPQERLPEPTWREPRAWLETLIFPHDAPANHASVRWIFRTFGPRTLDFAEQSTWPIANSNLLACAFLIAVLLWLRARRRLRMLMPWLALMVAGQILWTAEHHAGMLLIALVAACWLAFETGLKPVNRAPLDLTLIGLFAAVMILQIGWSAYCVHADVVGSYDPGPETARWLKGNTKPRAAAFGFATVSIQPWFAKSPFFDVPTSYWQWSSNVEVDGIHRSIVASHPDVVIYGQEFPGYGAMRDQWLPRTHISLTEERNLPRDLIVKDLHDHGYRETHRFCGTRFARFSSAYRVCDMVFEPNAVSSAP